MKSRNSKKFVRKGFVVDMITVYRHTNVNAKWRFSKSDTYTFFGFSELLDKWIIVTGYE